MLIGRDLMDRRQRKTRGAIFEAFVALLSKKHFNQITVGEIIELADVGRATFYAHFPTKDFLLRDLCEELFGHIFSAEAGDAGRFGALCCDTHGSAFLHLFRHVKQNDNNLARLLSCPNNDLFLGYFKNGVRRLVERSADDFKNAKPSAVPEDFWINHITASFIAALRWWLENGMAQPPELIAEYFLRSV